MKYKKQNVALSVGACSKTDLSKYRNVLLNLSDHYFFKFFIHCIIIYITVFN